MRLILAKIHMVTKQRFKRILGHTCLILAKIHMVTKLNSRNFFISPRLILAKIHMVTKHIKFYCNILIGLILAKIHMVTKQGVRQVNNCLVPIGTVNSSVSRTSATSSIPLVKWRAS